MGKQNAKKKKKKKKSRGNRSAGKSPDTPLSPVMNRAEPEQETGIDKIKDQDDRILAILGVEEEEDAEVNYENLEKFLAYLRKETTLPVLVTGIEDMGCFAWEEYYTFGPGSKAEYDKIRKTQPSFRDQYEFLDFVDFIGEEGLYANLRRISDGKEFTLPLADLETVDKRTKNGQLLNDYVVWQVNY
jgi:hypothetical protein